MIVYMKKVHSFQPVSKAVKWKKKKKKKKRHVVELHCLNQKETLFDDLNDQTTVVMPLYLGLVLSGESPSSMVFRLLLFGGGDCCNCWWWWCTFSCCSCLISELSNFWLVCSSWFSWFWSLDLVFTIWGLSLFKSDNLTGFKKNSSAPSSKHLLPTTSLKSIPPQTSNSQNNSSNMPIMKTSFSIRFCLYAFFLLLPVYSWRHILRWHDHNWYVFEWRRFL